MEEGTSAIDFSLLFQFPSSGGGPYGKAQANTKKTERVPAAKGG
jgi:hypothetical protein